MVVPIRANKRVGSHSDVIVPDKPDYISNGKLACDKVSSRVGIVLLGH